MKRPLPLLVAMLLLAVSLTPGHAQNKVPPQAIEAPVAVQDGPATSTSSVLPYRADRLLVRFTPQAKLAVGFQDSRAVGRLDTGLPTLDALNTQVGVQSMYVSFQAQNSQLAAQSGVDRWFTLEVPGNADLENLAQRYRNDPNVEAATPDYRAFPAVVPNDPIYPSQWGHNNTGQMLDYCWGCGGHPAGSPVGTVGFDSNAEAAWNAPTGFGSSSVIIAILDSGVDAGHPDINQMAGYDFGDNDTNPDDNSANPGHGTACAGVAAGISNNGVGVSGIAGGCTIMPLKVADSGGSLFFSYIQNALIYAADNGADVASMSFGAGITSDPATDNALSYAYNAGVTLLAATGNENDNQISYPAINSLVIAVGAASPCGERKRSSSAPFEVNPGVSTDPNGYTCDGERWWGSNYGSTTQGAGSAVDIIAPTIMPTTDIQGAGGYDPSNYSLWFNGTSCSTPYAAGVCALIVSVNPTWTPAQVRDRLRNTAIDVTSVESGAGWDRYAGYGMVDAEAAVGTTPQPPVAEFSGSPTSGSAPLTVNFTDLSTNTPTSWSWNFGDTNTSTVQNPSHTYTAAGTYTVSLTATNADGSDILTRVDYITVTAPAFVQRFAQSDIPGSGTVSGDYLDTQTSDNVRETITERESGGKKRNRYSYLEHKWDFNVAAGVSVTFYVEASRPSNSDGDDFRFEYSTDNVNFTSILTVASATEQVHSSALPSNLSGTVYVRVVDTDQTAGNRSLDSIEIDQMYIESATTPPTNPPVADFVGSPTTGDAPLVVAFSDLSTNAPTSWSWNFGDLNTSTLQNPSHTYTAAGTYTVSLTATNAVGSDIETKVAYITVNTPTGTVMHVGHMTVTVTRSGPWYRGNASVTVVDQNNNQVANATVSGVFNAPNGNTKSGVTDANGVATMTSDKTRTPPPNWCFLVNNITLSGATYNPGANEWTERCQDGTGTAAGGLGLSSRDTGFGAGVLMGNRPNPLRSSTVIGFRVPESDHVRLEIFDVAGRRVAMLADRQFAAGEHGVTWDASGEPAGIYFYKLGIGSTVETRKMLLIK